MTICQHTAKTGSPSALPRNGAKSLNVCMPPRATHNSPGLYQQQPRSANKRPAVRSRRIVSPNACSLRQGNQLCLTQPSGSGGQRAWSVSLHVPKVPNLQLKAYSEYEPHLSLALAASSSTGVWHSLPSAKSEVVVPTYIRYCLSSIHGTECPRHSV